jgi:hypothetical protein
MAFLNEYSNSQFFKKNTAVNTTNSQTPDSFSKTEKNCSLKIAWHYMVWCLKP